MRSCCSRLSGVCVIPLLYHYHSPQIALLCHIMVKNITIQGTRSGPWPQVARSLTGQLQCLGGAHAKARSGQDHYLRPAGQAWLIECVLDGSRFRQRTTRHLHPAGWRCLCPRPYAEFQYYPDDQKPWEKLFIEINGPLSRTIHVLLPNGPMPTSFPKHMCSNKWSN